MHSYRHAVASTAAAAVTLTFVVVPSAGAQETAAPEEPRGSGSRFTLGVIPDTQFYSRYSTPETGNLANERYGSEPYLTQTKWLVEHQDELNMRFATHLGDVVDQADVEGEWKVADEAMKVLDESDLNYSILPGNHDLEDRDPFGTWFPASRAKAANTTFRGRYEEPNKESEYHIFEAEGQQYLVLALVWQPGKDVLAWAQDVIDAHPELPVILTTHEALKIKGGGEVYYSEEYGADLWQSFIKGNDQIFLVMGGHHHGAGYRVDDNDFGHPVVAILQDYQMAYQGGNGLLGVLEFDLSGNELEMVALSPWVAQKPTEELTQFDKLILDGPGDSYRVPLNFAERFAGFAPEWRAGTGEEGDLAQAARDIVEAGYEPYQIAQSQLPTRSEDYVKAPGTFFHWRPGLATDAEGQRLHEGDAAAAGAIVPDVAGEGDLVREAGAAADRITYSADHHPLSADEGSLFWSDPAGNPAVAQFKSAQDAAINKIDTTQGYTFESFVKLPKDFNGSEHGWGNAISRDSRIADLVPGATDKDPTVMLGVSNLRELRWWAEPKEGYGSTVWSHEVPTDEWMHIAVINDPERDTVEMFINGAPILRNAVGAEGLLPRDLRWVMGAGMEDKRAQDPWYGWIGETRLSSGVLSKDQWLTARPSSSDENEATSTAAPSAEPASPSAEPEPSATAPSESPQPGTTPEGNKPVQPGRPGSSSSALRPGIVAPAFSAFNAVGALLTVAFGALAGLLFFLPVINRIFGLNLPIPALPDIFSSSRPGRA